ncbi:MAG: 16S rRNA (cytosine(1402)-N(4))-methyltransferase [Candidatus Marinimicrobia bacterium]|nr:16S rRNA (cytosine(1402)-N(4))-methyltransferase [Candidatus Neomarinimicrobiota bacterium]|tara:strand:+ start:15948 stop:16895 length:948 start_codon:yes stop_codon:yes gene_type:complete
MKNKVDCHPHIPVLLDETVSQLITKLDGVYVDCTVGFGGHAIEILSNIDRNGKLIGFDYDPYALEYSKTRLEKLNSNFELFLSNYSEIKKNLKLLNIDNVDGILFDLGISSYQVDSGYKGLSYQVDSPLDMQLSLRAGANLRDILHNSTELEIANIIYKYGEERGSRRIAKSISKYVKKNKMETNRDLVESIKEIVPDRFLNKTLSRVFQAFRIKVNNELDNMVNAINDAIDILKPEGRLAVITFHSIEDRLIKNIFRDFSNGKESIVREMGFNFPRKCKKIVRRITKKPICPTWDQIKANKRCRSAKLRIVEKI